MTDLSKPFVPGQISTQPYNRLYTLNGRGGISAPAQELWEEDDEKAIEQAKTLMDDHDSELWRDNKCIFKGCRAAAREPKQRPRSRLRY